jgi:hypothetical protein
MMGEGGGGVTAVPRLDDMVGREGRGEGGRQMGPVCDCVCVCTVRGLKNWPTHL